MLPYLREHGAIRQPARERPAPRQGVDEARRSSPAPSTRSRGRSSSPAAGRRPTTSRSRASPGPSPRGRHIVTTAVELAVLNNVAILERSNFDVTVRLRGPIGRVDPLAVADALAERTTLVSVMAANNEVGTFRRSPRSGNRARAPREAPRRRRPVRRARADRRERLAGGPRQPLRTQARRAAGRRRAVRPPRNPHAAAAPWRLAGASATRRTENVAGIVGFGAAFASPTPRWAEADRLRELSARLGDGLLPVDGVSLTGHETERRRTTSAS